MKLVQTADCLIYLDNIRVDPYVVRWNTSLGLSSGEATGSITLFRSKSLQQWKAYLTQIRVFVKNVFTGKYAMVFEGEVTNRSWDDRRGDSGKITYAFQGFFHWLQTPIPMMISNDEAYQSINNFIYEAQGVNYNAIVDIFQNQAEISMQDKDLVGIIDYLFKKMNEGYYQLGQENSSFGWAKVRDRFKIMVDINPEYRQSGFLDIFTLVSSTQIQSFYVYLNQVLSQMMFEFFQSRDGTIQIKNPSWSDAILKSHVIDESLISSIQGMDDWIQEPTRVLAIGGTSDLYKLAEQQGLDNQGIFKIDSMPIGLYIGDGKNYEDYYTQTILNLNQTYGITESDLSAIDGVVNTTDWYDDITGVYNVTSPFTNGKPRTDVAGVHDPHGGTDYAVPSGTVLRNLGGSGVVTYAGDTKGNGGNTISVEQTIGDRKYRFSYVHVSAFLVEKGAAVKPGQAIAKSGGGKNDPGHGRSTGAHLHLGIRDLKIDQLIDPDAFLKKMKAKVKDSKAYDSGLPKDVDPEFQRVKNAVAKFDNIISGIATTLSINRDYAKAMVAIAYDTDTRNPGLKDPDYLKTTFINAMLLPLQATASSDRTTIKNKIQAAKGQKFAERVIALFDKIVAERNNANAAPTDAAKYNVYAPTAATTNANTPPIVTNVINVVKNIVSDIKDALTPDDAPNAKSADSPKTQWMTYEATAYVANCEGCSGITATGKDVRDNSKDYKIIAVDPKVIPLHSIVEIKGGKGREYVSGKYEALDKGGAIKGFRIDVLMQTLAKANKFGRANVQLRVIRSGKGDGTVPPADTLRGIEYKSTNDLTYPIPDSGSDYTSSIKANAGRVDPNLVCAVIDVSSGWQRRASSGSVISHIGLMGIAKSYADAVDATSPDEINWQDGSRSIEFGSIFLAHCLDTLRIKPTLALAAYYIGNPEQIDQVARQVGAYDFVKMRDAIGQISPGGTEALSFVDKVIDVYLTTFKGDYVVGDPHKDFGSYTYGVPKVSTRNSAVDGFSNQFGLALSPEELRFKLNLAITEQRLIRYDSTAVANEDRKFVDQLIRQYAEYFMYISRARAHSVTVNLATCLPLIRPGFNVWLEPSRTDVVAYVTGVSHQGSFSQGCFTSLRTEFVRNPSDYDDVDTKIFLGDRYASAKDFGPVLSKNGMDDLRKKLANIHESEDEVVRDSYEYYTLKELYSTPTTSQSEYVGEWNAEYTRDEIDDKINEMYKSAPDVVKERMDELKKVIEESADFFMKKLFAEFNS